MRTTESPEVEQRGREDLDEALKVFLSQRTYLFRIASRVTGDHSCAEDVVQEAWLRWQRTDRTKIKNPAAFLTTTTTHLAINLIQSAPRRHEEAADSPLAGLVEPAHEPTARLEQAAAVEQMLGLLMTKLSSAELAAYVLRKGFDYTYVDIAALVRTSIPNARQLISRAQQRLRGDRARAVDPATQQALARAFLSAARTGELDSLEQLLSRGVRAAPGRSSPCSRVEDRRRRRPANSQAA